jgi:hypothetical protein
VNVSIIELLTHPMGITNVLNSNDFNFRKSINAIIMIILKGVTIIGYCG